MSEVSQNTSYVAGLEHQRDTLRQQVERGQIAMRLAQNPDFRKLIIEGFCRDDAARFVQESGDPLLSAEQRSDALAMAQASGHLKRFLSTLFTLGATAEKTIPEIDEALVEARAEEDATA